MMCYLIRQWLIDARASRKKNSFFCVCVCVCVCGWLVCDDKQCVDGGGGGGDHLLKFLLYLQKLKLGMREIFIHTNSSLQRASTTMGLNSLDSFFNKLVVRAFIVLCSTVKSARSLELRICPLKISAFTIEPVCVRACVCVCVCVGV